MDIVGKYEIKPFPKIRQYTIDFLEEGSLKHHVPSLFELDVTKARQYLRNHKNKTGESLSTTGWIMKCISQAVSEHKQVHAYRKGNGKLIIFDDVDICIIVEMSVNGEEMPWPYVVRRANEKSVREIHDEIRAAQAEKAGDLSLVLGDGKRVWLVKKLARWKFLRKLVWRKLRRDAFFAKKSMGTVAVTAAGMFGEFAGWGIPIGIHTLIFRLGTITKKPGVIGDKIEIREYLGVTVSVDHDIVDGVPMSRFRARLTELVESAFGLVD